MPQLSTPAAPHVTNFSRKPDESGHVLAIVLIIVSLAVFAMAATLQFSSTHLRTDAAFDQRAVRHYSVEASLNQVLSWLRLNSPSMSSAFKREQFYSSFSRTSMNVGPNDGVFPAATALKLAGSGQSPLFSNDATLGTSAFPLTNGTGSPFDAAASFAALNFGTAKVKLTLIDGLAQDQSLDTGASPLTDYFPVFRVDAMTHLDRGVHLYGYIVGSLVETGPAGFYGLDSVQVNQDCDAYNSGGGIYTAAAAIAACPIRSQGSVCIQNNASVFGEVQTTGTASTTGSCSGVICKDMQCAERKTACSGASCTPGAFPAAGAFSTLCPAGTSQGDYTVTAHHSETLTASASAKCWDTVKVGNNSTLVLTSTASPYYFRSLDLKGNLEIAPDADGKAVEVWVDSMDSTLNGDQVVNGSGRPSSFKMVYLGSTEVKLNGTAEFRMQFTAPSAKVTLTGNADFYGGIAARSLFLSGSGDVHYDQSLGTAVASDIAYKLVQVTHKYR